MFSSRATWISFSWIHLSIVAIPDSSSISGLLPSNASTIILFFLASSLNKKGGWLVPPPLVLSESWARKHRLRERLVAEFGRWLWSPQLHRLLPVGPPPQILGLFVLRRFERHFLSSLIFDFNPLNPHPCFHFLSFPYSRSAHALPSIFVVIHGPWRGLPARTRRVQDEM